MKKFNEAMINVDTEPADSVYSWYLYQKFISYFEKRFDEWSAYKMGIIDKNGKILRQPKTSQERNALNAVANLVRKLKSNMLKHSSDSTIKIISYYLKYGFRTQDLALKEFNGKEIKFLKNFNEMIGFNNMLSSVFLEQKVKLNFNGDLNFVRMFEDDGISVIKKLIGNVSIPFNESGLSNFLLKEFFNSNDVSIRFEDFTDVYKIIEDNDNELKAVKIHFPRKIVFNSVEDGKIGEIIISDAMMFDGKNQFNASQSSEYYNIIKIISSYLEDGLLDLIDKAGINCAINIDVIKEKISIYFRVEKIAILSGKIGEDSKSLSFDTIDNRLSDNFIMIISKQIDLTKFEETTGAGSLTGYATPLSNKRRKPVELDEEELDEEETEKLTESEDLSTGDRFIRDFKKKVAPVILKNFQLLYNDWQTKEDGTDSQININGICGDVADIIIEATIDKLQTEYNLDYGIGNNPDERHTYAIIYLNDNHKEIEFHVDIPYKKYENPVRLPDGRIHWRKRYAIDRNGMKTNIKFSLEDITIVKMGGN